MHLYNHKGPPTLSTWAPSKRPIDLKLARGKGPSGLWRSPYSNREPIIWPCTKGGLIRCMTGWCSDVVASVCPIIAPFPGLISALPSIIRPPCPYALFLASPPHTFIYIYIHLSAFGAWVKAGESPRKAVWVSVCVSPAQGAWGRALLSALIYTYSTHNLTHTPSTWST